MERFVVVLGVAGVIQAIVLPGFLVLGFLRVRLNLLLRLSLAVPLSMALNYILVCCLISVKLYSPSGIIPVFGFEIAALCWLILRGGASAAVPPSESDAATTHGGAWSDIEIGALMLGRCLAIFAVGVFAVRAIANVGTVFTEWDPALVWNLRAIQWAKNSFPGFFYNYPDIVPVTYSIPYAFIGTTRIQLFSKAIAPLFPLATVTMLLGLWWETKRPAYLFAISAAAFALNKILGGLLSEGYADAAVALVALGAVVLLLLAGYASSAADRSKLVFLAILAAAATAHTKQVGLCVAAAFPLLVLLAGLDWKLTKRQAWRMAFLAGTLIAVTVLPWYLAASMAMSSSGGSTFEYLSYLAVGAHAGSNFWSRFSITFQAIRDRIGLTALLGVLPASIAITIITDRFWGRVLVFSILPFSVAWLVLFSYDLRNVAMALPFFGVAVGVAAETITGWLAEGQRHLGSMYPVQISTFARRSERFVVRIEALLRGPTPRPSFSLRLMALVTCIVLLGGGLLAANSLHPDFLEVQLKKQRMVGEPEVNAAIYAEAGGAAGDVVTNYAILVNQLLPGFEQRTISCGCMTPTEVAELLGRPNVRYILLRTDVMPNSDVVSYLLSEEQAGRLDLRYKRTVGREFLLFKTHG